MPLNLSSDQQTALANIMSDIARKPNNGFGACVSGVLLVQVKLLLCKKLLKQYTLLVESILQLLLIKLLKLSNIVGEEVTTVHNLFNLRPSVTKSGVETILYNKILNLILEVTLMIIIDEASMVNTEMFKVLTQK